VVSLAKPKFQTDGSLRLRLPLSLSHPHLLVAIGDREEITRAVARASGVDALILFRKHQNVEMARNRELRSETEMEGHSFRFTIDS